jgi:hypothetical protein
MKATLLALCFKGNDDDLIISAVPIPTASICMIYYRMEEREQCLI